MIYSDFVRKKEVEDELMTDINVKTLTYIKNCKKQKTPRNIQMTRRYLRENNLMAVPFDKGIWICIMDQNTYNNKLDAIIRLPQFEKETQKRKNEKHPVLKGEERIVRTLKKLKEENKIDESLYEKLKPVGK